MLISVFFLHRCVQNNQCNGLLTVRGAGDLVCQDTSLTCCHNDAVIKQVTPDDPNLEPDYEQEFCSEYASNGFG